MKEASPLSKRRREILNFIDRSIRSQGYPPSVREIAKGVGLSSTSTVQSHLNTLEKEGYIRRNASKPRALEVWWGGNSDAVLQRRPHRMVPLIGDVAAGTDVLAEENFEELIPVPEDITGKGELFMLRVRGNSMIDAGIFNGDYVVVRSDKRASNGNIVVAGIPGEEATVKEFRTKGRSIHLIPHNKSMQPMIFKPNEVSIYGQVVTVMRRY